MSDTLLSPPAPAPAPASPRRPSTAGYWLGATIAVVATVAAVLWVGLAWVGWTDHIDRFPRLAVPGTVSIAVDEPGTRLVYVEGGRPLPAHPDLTVTVTDPAGNAVPVDSYGGDLRYDVSGPDDRVGKAVAVFHAAVAGTFRIQTTGAPGTVAVGDNVAWHAAQRLIDPAVVLFAGVAVGVTVIVVTASRRSRPDGPRPPR